MGDPTHQVSRSEQISSLTNVVEEGVIFPQIDFLIDHRRLVASVPPCFVV
jgi:hypothetical protein